MLVFKYKIVQAEDQSTLSVLPLEILIGNACEIEFSTDLLCQSSKEIRLSHVAGIWFLYFEWVNEQTKVLITEKFEIFLVVSNKIGSSALGSCILNLFSQIPWVKGPSLSTDTAFCLSFIL